MAKANGGAEKVPAKEKTSKKGSGPVAVTYLDDKGAASKRVPAIVSGIVVTNTKDASKNKTFSLSTLSAETQAQLAAAAAGKKLDTYIRNTVKNDNTADIVGAADKLWAVFNSGKLYSRAEGSGKGAGRPFDYQFWIDVMVDYTKAKGQPASEKALAGWKLKLETSTPKDRRELLKKYQKDHVFNCATKNVELRRQKDKAKSTTSEFNVLSELGA